MVAKDYTAASFTEALAKERGTFGGRQPLLSELSAPDFNTAPTPAELNRIYNKGFRGLKPETTSFEDKIRAKEFMGSMPRLYDIFPWAKGYGVGKISLPYLAALKYMPQWGGQDAQARGDCTVHGTYNAATMDYCNDALWGETSFKGQLACENIYRSRGFNGDGWSCEAPCMYVGPEGKGGLLFRQVYTNGSESIDLSKYNPSWSGNGRAGTPSWLEEESAKNKVKWVIPITSPEEYRDAIAIGFGINVCSGQGFSSSTDENGVARAQGSWSHAMSHDACVDTPWARQKYTDMLGGIQQSWGKWNTINGKPEGVAAMATGMFFSKFATINSMLRGSDSFALCSVWGWERITWEAFNITELTDHLHNSTTQDYYVERAKRITAFGEEAYDTGIFSPAV